MSMNKRIYLVKLTAGDCTPLDFVHGYHTDSVPFDRVLSCRELTRQEAFEMIHPEHVKQRTPPLQRPSPSKQARRR